jgi:tRNA-specific 2-thiouridylase
VWPGEPVTDRDPAPALTRSIAVAMSGGLDSSMALALLCEGGHDVIGVTMRLWVDGDEPGDVDTGNVNSARDVCALYGVEHVVLDLRDRFYERVVLAFISEYAEARTPNPCVLCNEKIKFGALLDAVQTLGYDSMATGHYARSVREGGRHRLLRGMDAAKDQSYFLYTLSQQQLAHVGFPLGGLTKAQVRALARERGMSVTERPASQDVCFMRGEPYSALLARLAPGALVPGPILNRAGHLLGTHRGLPLYTVGQRGGLGVAADRPLYVLELDALRNTLTVGYAHELGQGTLIAQNMHYVSGEAPAPDRHIQAQIRYRACAVDAAVEPLPNSLARLRFAQPVRDIAPGQAVVLYDGDEVLGGGTISRAQPDCRTEEF